MSELSALAIDTETLTRARGGDEAALEIIYRACWPFVHALVRRLIGRPAVAEEITQEIFLQVFRHLQHYTGDGAFGGWVRSIAVRKCLIYLRSPWRRAVRWLEFDTLDTDANEPARADLTMVENTGVRMAAEEAALEHALAKLSPVTRTVVWLHDVEGYTHAEIALELGRTPSFSKSQLARAHERLRALLSPSQEGVACTPASIKC